MTCYTLFMVLRIYTEEENILPLEPPPAAPPTSQTGIINLARQRSVTLLVTQDNNPLPGFLRRLDACREEIDSTDTATMDPDALHRFLTDVQRNLRRVIVEILHCPLAENRVYERAEDTLNAALSLLSLLPEVDALQSRLRQFYINNIHTLLTEDLQTILENHPNQHALKTARHAIRKEDTKTAPVTEDPSAGTDAEDWL